MDTNTEVVTAKDHEGHNPDVMNDPEYATNIDGDDGTGDQDTCRICRGEATAQEPLFYPCKCSGSIKFVHQDCLMEWLGHSQKKHCELCKTPFRFTKLYAPNMPRTLPLPVFIKHLAVHILKNIATWMRMCLVTAVWLVGLPWMMRHIWGLLFWFADGGWSFKHYQFSRNVPEQLRNSSEALAVNDKLASLAANGTSPASPLLGYPTTTPIMWEALTKLYELVVSHRYNMSLPEPSIMGIFNSIYSTMGLREYGLPSNISNRTTDAMLLDPYPVFNQEIVIKHPSLLSDVYFLKNLTRSNWVNRLIVTCLEGQIITVVVVVCFILIFLIREWVVQQQPGINMGAGFNAEFANPDAREQLPAHDPIENLRHADRGDVAAIDRIIHDFEAIQDVIDRRAEDRDEPVPARARRRMGGFDENNTNRDDSLAAARNLDRQDDRDSDDEGDEADESLLAELPTSIDQIDATEFIALWRRADGDADKILRLMEEEGLGERLKYWKSALEALRQGDAESGVVGSRRIGGVPNKSPELENGEELGESSRNRDGPKSRPEKSRLLTMDPTQQEQHIGDILYHKVKVLVPELAGRVTGMLLELETSELLDLVDDDDTLYAKMDDALIVYNGFLMSEGNDPILTNEKGKDQLLRELVLRKARTMRVERAEKVADIFLEMDIEDLLNIIEDDATFKTRTEEVFAFYELHLTQMRKVFPSRKAKDKYLAEHPDFMPPKITPSSSASSRAAAADEAATRFRPRSASDGGPKLPSALARDYWDFDGLPDTEEQHTNTDSVAQPQGSSTDRSTDVNGDNELLEVHASEQDRHSTMQDDLAGGADDVEGAGRQSTDDREQPTEPTAPLDGSGVATPQGDDVPPLENPPPPPGPGNGQPRNPPEGIIGHLTDWLWGDVDGAAYEVEGDDEHVVDDIDAEEPFVPRNRREALDHAIDIGALNLDDPRDLVQAVMDNQADELDPNDPNELDDAEDFDGIMELIGMHGPLTSLIQNALFGAVLISLTVALGVWLPYNVGKLTLLLTANPISTIKLPLKLVFKAAAVVQDLTLVLIGYISYALIRLVSILMASFTIKPNKLFLSTSDTANLALNSLKFAYSAGERVTGGFIGAMAQIPDSEIPAFSAASHESLIQIQSLFSKIIGFITGSGLAQAVTSSTGSEALPAFDTTHLREAAAAVGQSIMAYLTALPSMLAKPETWVIRLNAHPRAEPIDLALSYWDGTDRAYAIIAGYAAFIFLGAAYVRKGSPFSSSQTGKDWESTIIDVLNQAGGVMKVILIISIEMLVFPLYCGMLLDAATLPLFENATVASRAMFAITSPLTSIFVHWFVGTCYMFHFALFVSMCRKILRSGVLYFIRDPDDPTFHPVRDVLERNVGTQLRKITFSATVYGALVMICLGGVVWGLSFAFIGVLPITWSSNEPVLEFPVDLLFYNFLMPVAVKYFKPSDAVQAMYSWWFRRCARLLRLTWFLLDERMNDEEGYFPQWSYSWKRIRGDDLFKDGKPHPEIPFVKNGRYVRTPDSDMVRIPKSRNAFLEVNEKNQRIDGEPDPEEGLHGTKSKLFKMVYAPPWFRTRIAGFIFLLWLFAAITGCSLTLIPLVFGRWVFNAILPSEVKKNDIYAFSMGINILGGLVYCLINLRPGVEALHTAAVANARAPAAILRKLFALSIRTLRLSYAYGAFVFLLPTLSAALVEFYLLIPLHTYFAPGSRHTIRFVQSWTLGLLFVNLARRAILWYADSRPAAALRAVVRRGMLDPDVRLATRAFIAPLTLIAVLGLAAPMACAWTVNALGLFGSSEEARTRVYRYAFPAMTAAFAQVQGLAAAAEVVRGWRMSIRDEVYLIGERLHNFGESRRKGSVGIPSMGRIET
jgi:E3 ubiquitin-protein ligase DOA10